MDAAVRVERERAQSDLLHYEDILRHAQRALQVPEVARLIQRHYGAVLVAEFQDLSPQQLDLALLSCEANRTFVGDPLQGIYSWAGARPAQVEQALRGLCGDPVVLSRSFRSSPAVLEAVNSVAVPMGATPLVAAEPEKWSGGGVSAAVSHGNGPEEARWIVALTARILGQRPSASVGVISRAQWRRKVIDAAFAARSDIPCLRWDLAVDDPALLGLIREAARSLPNGADMSTLEAEVLARIGSGDAETFGLAVEALDQIRTVAEQSGSIGAALTQFRVMDENTAVPPGAHLLNAHTGKGQQFDWVVVPGLEKGHVPSFLAKTPEDLSEEERVLLVMLSRARHGVVITRAEQLLSKRGSWYATTQSPWWNRVSNACTADASGLDEHLNNHWR